MRRRRRERKLPLNRSAGSYFKIEQRKIENITAKSKLKPTTNWQTPRTKPSVLKFHRVPRKAASTELGTQNIPTRCTRWIPPQDSVDSTEGRY